MLLALNKVDNPRERYQHQVAERAIAVGVRHAVQERRLGQLRQRQHQDDLPVHSLCGSQRHARSADGGHYRENAGDAGQLRLHARGQARGEGHPVHLQRAGAGRKLVWALGRELHLRDVPGAARAGGHRHRSITSRRFSRRRSGFAWCRTPTAAGARPAAATTIPNTRGVGPSTPSQTAWALLGLLAAGDDRSDSIAKGVRWLLTRQRPDGSWDESTGRRVKTAGAVSLEQASPESFTWPTTCTANTSRCWL